MGPRPTLQPNLKKKIVRQLAGKTPAQQEAIIEQLLKLLDINLLAALAMAYAVSDEKTGNT